MLRFTHRLTVGLLTVVLVFIAATLWVSPSMRNTLLRLLRLHTPGSDSEATAGLTAGGECKEWAKSEVVSQGLGWDLSYMPTLIRSGYCPGGAYCAEWAKPQLPVEKYLAEWQGEPIISSMEIELPDGHAGYGIIWLIRSQEHAYSWTFSTSDLDKPLNKTPFPAQYYDSAFESVACWEQAEPPSREFGPGGYIGFLSLYKEGRARQMLLTYGDLYEGSNDPDQAQPGRLSRALLPLIRWAAERDQESTPSHK